MNELALRYEYLIRAGHQVGRLEIPAAHADTFRALERSFARNRDNKDASESAELLFRYAFDCGEVVTNISNALWNFEKHVEQNLTEQDIEELNKIEELLINAQMEQIDEAIEGIEKVFRRHGRFL